jgi:hypothetical protein
MYNSSRHVGKLLCHNHVTELLKLPHNTNIYKSGKYKEKFEKEIDNIYAVRRLSNKKYWPGAKATIFHVHNVLCDFSRGIYVFIWLGQNPSGLP